MRISDLKIVLKNLNTTITGKKSELINRILNSTSSDHLMLVLQSDGTEFYSLSDKGKKFVKNMLTIFSYLSIEINCISNLKIIYLPKNSFQEQTIFIL